MQLDAHLLVIVANAGCPLLLLLLLAVQQRIIQRSRFQNGANVLVLHRPRVRLKRVACAHTSSHCPGTLQ